MISREALLKLICSYFQAAGAIFSLIMEGSAREQDAILATFHLT